MSTTQDIMHVLSEATAIRLYNSVAEINRASNRTTIMTRRPTQAIMQHNSLDSIRSSNQFNTSCRICRWNRSDMEIVKCPCQCKGSVGFVHLPCLKTWIMHRRNDHCEICNAAFDIPEEKLNIRHMIKTFFSCCACPILKHLLFGTSLVPLAHTILQQVLICMENINFNPNEELTIQQVFVAAAVLMTSSAVLFQFFEFITTRFISIRNILRHWWTFGNSSDFALVQIEIDVSDLFN